MENKKFLSQANELGPNYGRAIRTETERKNLGVYLNPVEVLEGGELVLLVILLVVLVLL